MNKNWKSGCKTWKCYDATTPITSELYLTLHKVDKWKVDNGGKQ